ncbi:MAG: NADH-quinone oxidoreductase subunit L, partial [Gammaproteobacteria bacterium]
MEKVYLGVVLAPLVGSLIAGLFRNQVGRTGAHTVTILGVAISFGLAVMTFNHIVLQQQGPFNGTVYTWMVSDSIHFEVGFLIDNLTALMMLVVTFVSLMVHIYTIGYMHDDPGYQRFFSYIALFTFSMLMLVMANNFMQLFFGWEAVGLVSYLLIGFWFKKETAIYANLKAFLVNRVGDFGFLLGIALIVMYFNSLDYEDVFAAAPMMADLKISILSGHEWSLMTVICILLFIGAMGKSAQFPLHVWLPDSMEGPTPISALIHAATMVTAGIYMVARMSPLYELSETALSFVLIIGAITALFMAFLGMVQNDIKRVIAYSTLSQLGYMTVALGVSAYSAAIFHLMTHAFFKALLFLGAGSVIIAMHHEQDMRKMGGLWKKMPITYITAWIGTLALIGAPPFAGFFSKDLIIESVHETLEHGHLFGAGFAYVAVVFGALITAFYSLRLMFMTFHGKPRDQHAYDHAKESPWVVTVPLLFLAIPSLVIGYLAYDSVGLGHFFDGAIMQKVEHLALTSGEVAEEHGMTALQFMIHGMSEPFPILFVILGVFLAWFL